MREAEGLGHLARVYRPLPICEWLFCRWQGRGRS